MTAAVCEVCNKTGALVVWLGFLMHEKCMPTHWRKARKENQR